MSLSIIVPTLNEQNNIPDLVKRIATTLKDYPYEIIFIDDHSTDNTRKVITELSKNYPIFGYLKQGKSGKAFSILEGFTHARYDIICMIDADLQYPPEVIPSMLEKIKQGADIVVTRRKERGVSPIRKLVSTSYNFIFNKMLHGLNYDVQSGFKVFRRQVMERYSINPSPWTFDLEFILKAKDAGYKIVSQDIVFSERLSGKPKISIVRASFEIGWRAILLRLTPKEVIPFGKRERELKGNGFHYRGKEYVHYSNLSYKEMAFYQLNAVQKLILFGFASFFVLGLLLNWHLTIVVLLGILITLYFTDFFFTLYPIIRTYTDPAEIEITSKEMTAVAEREWPKYTVLCPLYKEWKVIPQFVNAMSKLDYPKDKLQILLLLEEDDTESVQHVSDFTLPSYFEVVVVPNSQPKTKPKACNYGLLKAQGEYTVIYDAEDVPDSLQLKKAVLAFEKTDQNVACVQAKLNFYNPQQNALTRAFSAEYSLWFDLVLPGLQSIGAPIPLGGTSNHFNTKTLRLLKGWDGFNVTEDCDLGLRLFKKGYATIIIDSETLEEANSSFGNWFAQRGRWLKGYVQSYFVHMRNPGEFMKTNKKYHIVTFQFIIIGKVMSMFINFFMWTTTIAYFLLRPELGTFIESFFPAQILYMGVFCFVIGNFLYMYYYMIGCMKHGHYELLRYVLLVPFYWLMMSFAAWGAIYKFIVAPHYWYKTKHGLLDRKSREQMWGITGLGESDLAPVLVTEN